MPLTIAQKMAIRRHLKFPVVGNIAVSPAAGTLAQGFVGYRFFQAYGALEYKLNNLQPVEEAALLGLSYGAAAFVGPQPNVGDQISITLSGGPIGSPQTVTATAQAPLAPFPNATLQLVATLAAAIAQNAVLKAAGVVALAPYGTGPFNENAVPVPELSVTAGSNFTITGAGTGAIVPQITAAGVKLEPTCSLDGGNTVLWGYLPILNGLEGAYLGTSDNLDTSKADVWTARPNEAGQRRSLYESYLQMMADFLGIPTFLQATQRPKRTGAVSYT